MKKKYLLGEGDNVEIHLNENGFDYSLKGLFQSVTQDGIMIQNEEGLFFNPMGRVLYMHKKKEVK